MLPTIKPTSGGMRKVFYLILLNEKVAHHERLSSPLVDGQALWGSSSWSWPALKASDEYKEAT